MTPSKEQNKAPVANLKEMEICMPDKEIKNSLRKEAQ